MLFRNVWQAAPDHGRIWPWRQARGIWAGDGSSGALRALAETLKATPTVTWLERRQLWHSQWGKGHGATAPSGMRRAEATPDSLRPEWLAQGTLANAKARLALVPTTLSARIAGFPRQRMPDMAKACRAGAPQVAP